MILNTSCLTHTWGYADLTIADPPWRYSQRHGASSAEDHYDSMSTVQVVNFLDALPGTRLALWMTFPLLAEWMSETHGWNWGAAKTGGSWVKSRAGDEGHYGQGYHWAGCSEIVLVYTRRDSYTNRAAPLRNAWIEPPSEHSRKPVGWMTQWIKRWVPPGGRVNEPFAGTGSGAEATRRAGAGRFYTGTEIDPIICAAANRRLMETV